MRGLRWHGSEEEASSEVARARLREVRGKAQAAAGKELDWSDHGRDVGAWWEDALVFGCLFAGLVLVALMVIGALTVLGWLF